MIRTIAAATLSLALPMALHAAGSGSDSPPTPTETTSQCKNGLVWNPNTKKCAAPQSGSLDDDTLYGAVREFAYAGQYRHALDTLDAMSEQQSDRVLTYRGFATRKLGDIDAGMAFYREAIELNPDNLLVRSYMGQALVEQGEVEAARVQLTEIRARGGRSTWPEYALRNAIESGRGYSY
ncbi:tetratricopeptide repeat protein [Aliiruegeria haliotis]|uniref:Tetratricopeptide repeat protein n=1 Tax=Aliiruegeria haliotis TaxID=1280846 RepID=A0A2T0RRF7_9RHOB|nr:tetratricopeptide repeat protein [Aliiruegeria haliotis]PRY23673.1 tetratricopeptide repeat protein [Aliiruegeria haliotis]